MPVCYCLIRFEGRHLFSVTLWSYYSDAGLKYQAEEWGVGRSLNVVVQYSVGHQVPRTTVYETLSQLETIALEKVDLHFQSSVCFKDIPVNNFTWAMLMWITGTDVWIQEWSFKSISIISVVQRYVLWPTLFEIYIFCRLHNFRLIDSEISLNLHPYVKKQQLHVMWPTAIQFTCGCDMVSG